MHLIKRTKLALKHKSLLSFLLRITLELIKVSSGLPTFCPSFLFCDNEKWLFFFFFFLLNPRAQRAMLANRGEPGWWDVNGPAVREACGRDQVEVCPRGPSLSPSYKRATIAQSEMRALVDADCSLVYPRPAHGGPAEKRKVHSFPLPRMATKMFMPAFWFLHPPSIDPLRVAGFF